MRQVRLTGELMSGVNVQFLSFVIRPYSDPSIPSGNTQGVFYDFGSPGDYRPYLCVSKYDLAEFFGRRRKFECNAFMTGQYEVPTTSTPGERTPGIYDYTIDETLTIDVVKPLHSPNERFLPHGRHVFWNVIDGGDAYAYVGRTMQLYLTGRDSPDYLVPLNATVPLDLYDVDAFGNTPPDVIYSIDKNAFYLGFGYGLVTFFGKVGYGLPLSGLNYIFGIQANLGRATPTSDADWTYADVGSIEVGTWALPAYSFIPTGLAPGTTITGDPVFTVSAPATDGYFENRDSDDFNPIWDKDDGTQLIIPNPVNQ